MSTLSSAQIVSATAIHNKAAASLASLGIASSAVSYTAPAVSIRVDTRYYGYIHFIDVTLGTRNLHESVPPGLIRRIEIYVRAGTTYVWKTLTHSSEMA